MFMLFDKEEITCTQSLPTYFGLATQDGLFL